MIDEFYCRLQEHIIQDENGAISWDEIKQSMWIKKNSHSKRDTCRYIKSRFKIVPQRDRFNGLSIHENNVTEDAALHLIDELKLVIEQLIVNYYGARADKKFAIGVDNESVKIVCISANQISVQ